jgi:hypothetical protein
MVPADFVGDQKSSSRIVDVTWIIEDPGVCGAGFTYETPWLSRVTKRGLS